MIVIGFVAVGVIAPVIVAALVNGNDIVDVIEAVDVRRATSLHADEAKRP